MTEIGVYYMYHKDSLKGLTPFLLLDGERVWHAAKKNGKYYLFLTESVYMKLWKDSKGNLLTYIGYAKSPMFMTGELDILEIDITMTYLQFIEDAMYIGNNYFKFTIPIIGIVRRLNEQATRPLVYLLYQLLIHSPPAQDEAQEVQEEVA